MRCSAYLLGVSLSVLGTTSAIAQDAQPGAAPTAATQSQPAATKTDQESPGDIVVTAQHRAERLQNVGIAVAAYTGDQLKVQGITSSSEIARLTPGVVTSGAMGGQSLQFSMRGVTLTDYNDGIEAPVAVYVDDSYIASQQGQGMALYDIERVEALKGPQGTLFGRNATGGLAQFIVNKPKLGVTSGSFDATYGSFNQTILEGALNLPVGDKIAVRLSGIWNRHDPYWHNVSPAGIVAGAPQNFGGSSGVSPGAEDQGNADTLSGRLQILVKPTETLTIRLTGSALRQNMSTMPWTSYNTVAVLDSQGRQVGEIFAGPNETRAAIGPNGQNVTSGLSFGLGFSPNNDGHRAPGANLFGSIPANIDDKQTSLDYATTNADTFRAYNGALHVDADLGGAQLASISSYSIYKKQFVGDADSSPINIYEFGSKSKIDTFSQELRLSNSTPTFNWQVGAYFLHIKSHVATGLLAAKGSFLAQVFGMTDTGVDPLSIFTLKTDSGSLFGQASWEFAPKLTLVAGGRIIREHQNYQYAANAYTNVNDYTIDDNSAPLFSLYPTFNNRRSNTMWAGKAQLEYRPNHDLLLYAGVNRGVKGGSYNGQLFDGSPPLSTSQIPYKPEELTSFEGGFKLTQRHFTFNASAFHYIYHNYQSFTFNNLSGFVSNNQARTTGIEGEATAHFGGLQFGGNIAWLHARVKNFEIAPGVFRDTRPTYAPKWAGSAFASYKVPGTVLGGAWSFGADMTYESSFYSNARNFAPDLFAGRTLYDLNTSLEFENGLSLGAYVKNLTDKRYLTVGIDMATACGCNEAGVGDPRTWGVKLGYKF